MKRTLTEGEDGAEKRHKIDKIYLDDGQRHTMVHAALSRLQEAAPSTAEGESSAFALVISALTALTQASQAVLGGLQEMRAVEVFDQVSNVFKLGQHTDASRQADLDSALLDLLDALFSHNLSEEQAAQRFAHCVLAIIKRQTPARQTTPTAPHSTAEPSTCCRAIGLLTAELQLVGSNFLWGAGPISTLTGVVAQCCDFSAQEAACKLLGAMPICASENLAEAGVEGLVRALVDALIAADVQRQVPGAARALHNLVEADEQHDYARGALDDWEDVNTVLLPLLVQRILRHPEWQRDDLRLLRQLVATGCVREEACTTAGALQAALHSVSRCIKADSTDPADTAAAVSLVHEILTWGDNSAARSFVAQGGVQTLVAAICSANAYALELIASDLYYVIDETEARPHHRSAALQCVRAGAGLWLQQRLDQLDQKEVQETRTHVQKYLEHQASRASVEFMFSALLPLSQPSSTLAAISFVEHAPLANLQAILPACDVIKLACDCLFYDGGTRGWREGQADSGGGDADPHVRVEGLDLVRAASRGLLALLIRLGGCPDRAVATGTGSNATAEVDGSPSGVVMMKRLALGEEALLGQHRFREVKVVVEGQPFYMLKDALVAASPAFLAMLDSSMAEQAGEVHIRDVSVPVWRVVMRYIFTDSAAVPAELAQEVLWIAEQYQMAGLKTLCEEALAAALTPANLSHMMALNDMYRTPLLQNRCVALALKTWADGGMCGAREPLPSCSEPTEAGQAVDAERSPCEDPLCARVVAALLPWLHHLLLTAPAAGGATRAAAQHEDEDQDEDEGESD